MSCCRDNDALMVDSNGCFICDSPKVKGRFGLAWVSESPDCPCPEPTGWQVEFLDTPSKVEQKCQEMVRWINCPPLPRCDPCPPDELCCPTNPPRCNPCAPKCNPCLPTCCPLPKCTCKPPPPPCCCKVSPCCCKKERKKEKRSCCCSCRPKRNCCPPMGGPCCRNRSPRKRSPQRCCCSDEQELPKCTCDDIPVKDTNNGVNASSSANTLTIYKNRNQYNTDTDNFGSSEAFVRGASSTCPQARHSRKTLNSCDCKSGYNSVEPSSYVRPLYSRRRISEDLIMDERRPLVQQESCQCSLYQSELYGTNSRTYVNVDTSYSRSRFITECNADDYYSACAESGRRFGGGSSRQVCTCNSVLSGEYRARPSRSVDETYGRSSRKDVYEQSFEQSSRTIDNYKETVACSCRNERSSRSIDKDACPCRNFHMNDPSSKSIDNTDCRDANVYKNMNDRSSRSIDNKDCRDDGLYKNMNDQSSRSIDNRLCTNRDRSSKSVDKEHFCNNDESKETKESSGETVEPFDERKTCRSDDVKADDSNSLAEKDAADAGRMSSEEVADPDRKSCRECKSRQADPCGASVSLVYRKETCCKLRDSSSKSNNSDTPEYEPVRKCCHKQSKCSVDSENGDDADTNGVLPLQETQTARSVQRKSTEGSLKRPVSEMRSVNLSKSEVGSAKHPMTMNEPVVMLEGGRQAPPSSPGARRRWFSVNWMRCWKNKDSTADVALKKE